MCFKQYTNNDVCSLTCLIIMCFEYMQSLIPKGAKSTFVTLDIITFLCASLSTCVYGKLNIEFTVSLFCTLYAHLKCILKVGGKLNNVVILVTRF